MRPLAPLARMAVARPWLVITSILVLSGGFAATVPQAVMDDAIAVDNPPARTQQAIDEEFGQQRTVVQVLLEAPDGSLISAEGLRAAEAVETAVRSSPAAPRLVDGDGQPPIAGPFADVQMAASMARLDATALGDAELQELRSRARGELPEEFGALLDELVDDTSAPTRGLVLVFLDLADLDDDAALDVQQELAAAVADLELPDGFTAEAFSFGLLLGGSDIGPEIGRLFGTALAIILLVLFVVYWVPPGAGQRIRIARRTTADVALTLLVIVLSVVWMQGAGVLLGPGFAGLIGPFSPQTQIVPILIVGLGVDFAIHLLARYRTQTAASNDVARGLDGTIRTVGPTLALCTAATAIGFLTNLASPVDFLATLGVLAAVGITAAFVLALTLLPAARTLLDRRGQRRGTLPSRTLGDAQRRGLPRAMAATSVLAERIPGTTVVVALALTMLGGIGFTQLDTEFELTDFVPQDSPGLATFDTVAASFNGGFEETTQVLLRGEVGEAERDGSLDAAIRDLAEVDGVERLGDAADATVTISDDGGLGRVELRTTAGQSGASRLAEDIGASLASLERDGIEVAVTSSQLVQARIGEDIEDAQITSLLIALGAAMVLLAVYYRVALRRAVLGPITVLPVVLVLAATFGTMALTGIPLNAVTATLAALSIGIGVPFTIHVTGRFLEERMYDIVDGRPPAARDGALRRTVAQTGGALAGSALTTAIGFGVLTTSTLRPFEQLGYVIVYAIAYSFVAAVLVLPSLLALWDRFDRRATRRRAMRHGGSRPSHLSVWTARRGAIAPPGRHSPRAGDSQLAPHDAGHVPTGV